MQDDKLGEFYTVERILKKERDLKTKRLKFLVEFSGYDDNENMWLSWQDFTQDMKKIASATACPPLNQKQMQTFKA